MEIQKIFSSWEDGEKLYSVLMTEEEMHLFANLGGFKQMLKKAPVKNVGVFKENALKKSLSEAPVKNVGIFGKKPQNPFKKAIAEAPVKNVGIF